MGKTFPILQNPRLIYRGVHTADGWKGYGSLADISYPPWWGTVRFFHLPHRPILSTMLSC